jgi:hypothetical protein
VSIFENLKDPVIEKAIISRKSSPMVVGVPPQSTVVCPNPQDTIGILVDRSNVFARQTILLRPMRQGAIADASQSTVAPDPNVAMTALHQHANVAIYKLPLR